MKTSPNINTGHGTCTSISSSTSTMSSSNSDDPLGLIVGKNASNENADSPPYSPATKQKVLDNQSPPHSPRSLSSPDSGQGTVDLPPGPIPQVS